MGLGFFAGERVFAYSFQKERENTCPGTVWGVKSCEMSRTATFAGVMLEGCRGRKKPNLSSILQSM